MEKNNSRQADLVIVGGGAAGMMAGILAARAGLRVSILEKNQHFGKKLSVTGNGKCNLTNAVQTPDCYRSDTPKFAWDLIERYPVSDTLALLREVGIEPQKRGSGYYPASEQASDVTKAFLYELERLLVTCRTRIAVTEVVPEKNGFLVQTKGYAYPAVSVLLTTGGLAAPQYGTTGDGEQIAARLGHRIIPPCPALTALKTGEHPVTRLAGLRRNGRIRLYQKETLLCEEIGELQFTSYGISGIPAMQISRYAARALESGERVSVRLDFCPEQSLEDLTALLHRRSDVRKERKLSEWFIGWLPEKLGSLLSEQAGLKDSQRVAEITEEGWNRLAVTIKNLSIPLEGVRSYEAAQTTAGGVALTECSRYLESKLAPGVFFAGEVLDVDGACGGYNLQWAWSSAACAVEGILKRAGERT